MALYQNKRSQVHPPERSLGSDFWDAKNILLNDYLARGSTITGEYYAHLLEQLDKKISKTRPGLQMKKYYLPFGHVIL